METEGIAEAWNDNKKNNSGLERKKTSGYGWKMAGCHRSGLSAKENEAGGI